MPDEPTVMLPVPARLMPLLRSIVVSATSAKEWQTADEGALQQLVREHYDRHRKLIERQETP